MAIDEGFTQKEMLIRILDKLEKMENKINDTKDRVTATHELASTTNGKVKLHTKAIFGLAGVLVTVIGWIISIILK